MRYPTSTGGPAIASSVRPCRDGGRGKGHYTMGQHACSRCGSTRTALAAYRTADGIVLSCENAAACRERQAPRPEWVRRNVNPGAPIVASKALVR